MAGSVGVVYDRASILLKVDLTDPQGASIDQGALVTSTWTLLLNTDPDTVINGKAAQAFPTQNADGSYYIGLTDADVAFADGDTRYVLIEVSYNDSYAGKVMNIKDYVTFTVEDLRNVI